MKKKIQEGKYSLIETKKNTKVLILDKEKYAWINAKGIGEILVKISDETTQKSTISSGRYELWEVDDDPDLIDLQHLQLEIGDDKWQGYLLTTGLPDSEDKKHRIIPTDETI